MVQDGPRFQNGQRCLKHWKKYILQTYGLSAEGAKAGGKKGNARPSSPFLWFNLFSVFFSFLFVQIFPCGQVDKLLGMSHGAISPSLMALFDMGCKEYTFTLSKTYMQVLCNVFLNVAIRFHILFIQCCHIIHYICSSYLSVKSQSWC